MRPLMTIMLKELRIELRRRQMFNSSLILSMLVLASFRFILFAFEGSMTDLAAPIIWITIFFGGMFSMSPIYRREIEQGTIRGLQLAPISPSSIFAGKFFATLIIMLVMESLSITIFFIFFPVDLPDMLALITVVLLGTIGFCALGNIISAISANLSRGEIMLPILLVPLLLFTVVLSSLNATSTVFEGGGLFDIVDEIRFIIVFDVIYLILGYLLMPYLIEE